MFVETHPLAETGSQSGELLIKLICTVRYSFDQMRDMTNWVVRRIAFVAMLRQGLPFLGPRYALNERWRGNGFFVFPSYDARDSGGVDI